MTIDLGITAPVREMEELAEELQKTYCEFEINCLVKALELKSPKSYKR